MARAEGLAIGLGARTMTPEHVLLAILWDPALWLNRLLERAGATPARLLEELGRLGVPTPRGLPPKRRSWGPFVTVSRDEFERVAADLSRAGTLSRFRYEGEEVLLSVERPGEPEE